MDEHAERDALLGFIYFLGASTPKHPRDLNHDETVAYYLRIKASGELYEHLPELAPEGYPLKPKIEAFFLQPKAPGT